MEMSLQTIADYLEKLIFENHVWSLSSGQILILNTSSFE